MSRLIKHKTIPFKLLVYLLYHIKPWIIRHDDGSCTLLTGQCARALRTSVSRLAEYMTHLAQANYITDMTRSHGKFNFIICTPILQPMQIEEPQLEPAIGFELDFNTDGSNLDAEETPARLDPQDPWKLN